MRIARGRLRAPTLSLTLWALAAIGIGGGAGTIHAVGQTIDETRSEPATVTGVVTIPGLQSFADAVVYLDPVRPRAAGDRSNPRDPETTDRSQGAAPGRAVINQIGLAFEPHVLVVPVGTVVEFRNSDSVLHNIFAPGLNGERFDLGTWPQGEAREHRFDEPGVTLLLCNVHPEMEAYVVVVPSTHYALTDESGTFEITDVPPGHYILRGWHERCVPARRRLELAPGERRDLELELTPAFGP